MKYIEFYQTFQPQGIVDIRNAMTYFNHLDRRRLAEWQSKGYLSRLCNNYYIFNDYPLNDELLRNIACTIYSPSYVGLISAMSYYGFIPEAVFQIVNITTRRNRLIRTAAGVFRYHSIRPELYFGISCVTGPKHTFYISDPEKTLLDMIYFFPGQFDSPGIDAMRLNQDSLKQHLDPKKLANYMKIFSSPALVRTTQRILEQLNVKL